MFVVVALLPIIFWLAVFTLVIVLVVRWGKNKTKAVNEANQKLVELTRIQQESTEQQKHLIEELGEVKNRLQAVEQIIDKTQ